METIDLSVLAHAGLATTGGPDYLQFFGRLHPLAVHFPVALILVAALFELPTMLRRRSSGGGHSLFAHRCFLLGAVAAAVAAWFGWLNADLESHSARLEDRIFLHRWLGVATASLAILAVGLPMLNRGGTRMWASRLYRLCLVVCAGTLAVGGHIGGELVYGEGYVLAALRAPSEPDPAMAAEAESIALPDAAATVDRVAAADPSQGEPAADRITFVRHIRPIFAESCFHCHGPDKGKGGLRLHRKDTIFGEEREWWVVLPGDVEGSLLLEMITKPADDDDLMPADDGPLPAESIALIARWIDSGAEWGDESDAVAVAETPAVETATDAGLDETATTEAAVAQASPSLPEPRSVDEAAIANAADAVRTRGGVVTPIAQTSPAIDVTFAVGGSAVDDDALSTLAGLEPVLAWLDLGRTSVSDAGVAELVRFGELRRLHLERTAITDACIDDLVRLRHLRYLNLYGTAVTDAAVDRLATLEHLEQVYLWDTAVTEAGLARLAEARPGLSVVAALDLPPLEDVALQIKGTPAPCCAEAAAGAKACEHECCIAAAAEGKVCEKCGGVPE